MRGRRQQYQPPADPWRGIPEHQRPHCGTLTYAEFHSFANSVLSHFPPATLPYHTLAESNNLEEIRDILFSAIKSGALKIEGTAATPNRDSRADDYRDHEGYSRAYRSSVPSYSPITLRRLGCLIFDPNFRSKRRPLYLVHNDNAS